MYTYENKTKDNIYRGWATYKQIRNLYRQDTGSQRKIQEPIYSWVRLNVVLKCLM